MSNLILVAMHAKVNYVVGRAPTVRLESVRMLRLPNGRRFGVGAIPRGQEGRQYTDGPMTPGPWAFAWRVSSVLSDSPEAELAKRLRDMPVELGDVLLVDGCDYRIEAAPNDHILLRPIDAEEA